MPASPLANPVDRALGDPAPPGRLVVAALALLSLADVALLVVGLGPILTAAGALGQRLPARPMASRRHAEATAAITRGIELYPRRVRCLQSATATAALLRLMGVSCALVIGVRRVPFLAHAWVEVDGRVVMNDEPGRMHLYRTMTRC